MDQWEFGTQSVMENLPESDLTILKEKEVEYVYKKGEVIFKEGTFASGIFFVKKGKVKKYKVDREGREQIVYVANAGELIGYHAVLSSDSYLDSAAALEEVFIIFIPRQNFLEAIEQSDVLSKRLLKTLSHEFAVLTNTLTLFAQRSVKERLALQLIVLREKYKENFEPGMPVKINMSRDDLASLVGTARENVVRMLSEFKTEGIVKTEGRKIVVLDVKRLIQISNYS